MKPILKTIWNVAVLAYPVWWAWGVIPTAIGWMTGEFEPGLPHWGLAERFPVIDVFFGHSMDLLLTALNQIAIAFAFTSFCWRVVKRKWRITMTAMAVATPVFVVGHGIQSVSSIGFWSFGVDAFQTWIVFCITAWPVVLLGIGYPEMCRRIWRRFRRPLSQTHATA